MKGKAAQVRRALCRGRVVEEMRRHRGTHIAEHLNLMLNY